MKNISRIVTQPSFEIEAVVPFLQGDLESIHQHPHDHQVQLLMRVIAQGLKLLLNYFSNDSKTREIAAITRLVRMRASVLRIMRYCSNNTKTAKWSLYLCVHVHVTYVKRLMLSEQQC